ncbi:MAG: hypothetical protein AAGJ29_12315 [Pseudomonadota bacterium]
MTKPEGWHSKRHKYPNQQTEFWRHVRITFEPEFLVPLAVCALIGGAIGLGLAHLL